MVPADRLLGFAAAAFVRIMVLVVGRRKAHNSCRLEQSELQTVLDHESLVPVSPRSVDGLYVNDDHSECIVLERFRDSEALIEHLAHLGDLMEAILATVSVVHGELLGEPSAELRAKLAGSEVPDLFTPFQSM